MPTPLTRLVYTPRVEPIPTAIEFPADVARFRAVLNAAGYDAEDVHIQQAYAKWNEEEMGTTWLTPWAPSLSEDARLLGILLSRLSPDLAAETDPPSDVDRSVLVSYANHRGEHAFRRIVPGRLYWGCNEWHPEPQWLLDAVDTEKGPRTFALLGFEGFGKPGKPNP